MIHCATTSPRARRSPECRIGKSTEHVIAIGQRHTLKNHNHTVMVCQERHKTFSNCVAALTKHQQQSFDRAAARDNGLAFRPEILRFSDSVIFNERINPVSNG